MTNDEWWQARVVIAREVGGFYLTLSLAHRRGHSSAVSTVK
jgi:hypothetical protein